MKSKQLCLAADERNELERFAKTGARNTRLVNRAKGVLALDTSGGRFRWQSMAADGSRNWKLETNGAVRNGSRWPPTAVETGNWKRTALSAMAIRYLGSKRIPTLAILRTEGETSRTFYFLRFLLLFLLASEKGIL